jgi:hypothetical protein
MAKVTDATYTELAEKVISTGRIDLLSSGLWFKPLITHEHLAVEIKKAMSLPPFKTEAHIQKIAESIRKLTTTKQPKYVAIPD